MVVAIEPVETHCVPLAGERTPAVPMTSPVANEAVDLVGRALRRTPAPRLARRSAVVVGREERDRKFGGPCDQVTRPAPPSRPERAEEIPWRSPIIFETTTRSRRSRISLARRGCWWRRT